MVACPFRVKLRHVRPNGLCPLYPRYRKRWPAPAAAWSPVRTLAIDPACGEIGRVFLDSFPGRSARAFPGECLLRNRALDAPIDFGSVHGPDDQKLGCQRANDVSRSP